MFSEWGLCYPDSVHVWMQRSASRHGDEEEEAEMESSSSQKGSMTPSAGPVSLLTLLAFSMIVHFQPDSPVKTFYKSLSHLFTHTHTHSNVLWKVEKTSLVCCDSNQNTSVRSVRILHLSAAESISGTSVFTNFPETESFFRISWELMMDLLKLDTRSDMIRPSHTDAHRQPCLCVSKQISSACTGRVHSCVFVQYVRQFMRSEHVFNSVLRVYCPYVKSSRHAPRRCYCVWWKSFLKHKYAK